MGLSLCMIVKNEEAWLRGCLSSVQGLVDEIIVVDTGSTDSTLEIARSFGAKTFPQVWKNDFSEARNASLSAATQDWILVLDADEVIAREDHAALRKLMQNPPALYSLIQTNYAPESSVLGWIPNRLQSPEAKGYPGYLESPLIRLFPRDARLRFQGMIHEHLIQPENLYPLLNTALRIHHYGKYSSSDVLKKKDELYLKITEEKYRQNPGNAHIAYEMAIQYWCMGRGEEAEAIIQEAIQLDPSYTRAWLAWASILHGQKKYPEAAKAYAKVMELEAKHPAPYLFLPVILLEMNQAELAQQIVEVGRKIVSDYASFHVNEGVLCMSQGKNQKAFTCFQKALTLNPDESLAWLNSGIARMALNQMQEAEADLLKATEYAQSRFEAYRRLIHLHFKSENLEKAFAALQEAKKMNASHPEILVNEVVLYFQKKEWLKVQQLASVLWSRSDLSEAQRALLAKCLQQIPEKGKSYEPSHTQQRTAEEKLRFFSSPSLH